MALGDSDLEIIIKASNETKAAFAETSAQLDALTAQFVGSNGIVAATGAASAGFLNMGKAISNPAVLGGLAGLILLLSPFIALLGTLTVGIVSMTALFTVGMGAIAGVAGVMFLLAKATDQGTAMWKVFTQQVKDVATVIGKASLNEFGYMLKFMRDFIPLIEAAGLSLVAWFDKRAPAIFTFLYNIVLITSGAMLQLGKSIGLVVDYVLANSARFENFWRVTMGIAVISVQQLFTGLMNLANWFYANWPKVLSIADFAAKSIAQGFNLITLNGGLLAAQLDYVRRLFDYVAGNMRTLQPLWVALGVIVGALTVSFLSFAASILVVVGALERIIERASQAYSWLQKVGAAIGAGGPASTGGGNPHGGQQPRGHSGLNITGSGMAMVMAGERILPPGGGGGGGGSVINISLDLRGSVIANEQQFLDRIEAGLMQRLKLAGAGGRL